MWWWRKVRRANISDDLRTKFERYGETVIAHALGTGSMSTHSGPLFGLLNQQSQAALDWLTERRDIHERREDRLETVEIAILLFVVIGVVMDLVLVIQSLHRH